MPNRPPQHNPRPDAPRRAPDNRESASARGYGAHWQKLRKWFAAYVPAICDWPGCNYAGPSREMHLDHRIAREKGGTDDPGNLHWLCHKHHSEKTVKEDGGLGHLPTK